jgi:hypothetical protein
MEVDVLCPWHNLLETVRVPRWSDLILFDGEVACGSPSKPLPIRITVREGEVVLVGRSPRQT